MSKVALMRVIIGLASGLLFGAGMVISEMVDPNKVIGFLNISGDWDPSLAFVMGGALLVFSPIYHLMIKKRNKAINGETLSLPSNCTVDRTLISGAVIFGVGWGLAGFCPGPVVASLGGGSHIILVFMICMLIGMACAGRYLSGRLPLPIVGYRKET